MTPRRFWIFALALSPVALLAQEDASPPPAAERPRDPFATPPAMRDAAGSDLPPEEGGGVPAATERVALVLRGTLAVRGRPPAALLDVGGRVLLVRPGDLFESAAGPLRVVSIGPGELVVQQGSRRRVVR
ncbi:MAG: hypothetical protein D6731_04945 [Planctomycetota bacterium]|nr:MAG: hypothetical protein D6731_04945 [Planctomycetota bacterium]